MKAKPKTGEDTPAVDDVEDLLDVAGDNTHWFWFYRERSGSGNWPYLGKVEPEKLRAAGIREYARTRWGGGHFRAKLRHVNGTWGQSRGFTIEGAPIIPRHDEPVASTAIASPSPGNMPAWVEKLVLPIGVTFATALGGFLAKKLLDTPAPDPLLLQLVKQLGGATAGIDPLELQQTIAAAEQRGEQRGRELGELKAQVETKPAADGVIGAIDRGLPQVMSVLNRKLELDAQRMTARAPVVSPAAPSTPVENEGAPAVDVPTDSLVALLLSVPLVARKFLLSAAEGDEPPEVYAGLVLGKLDDLTYARMPQLLERADFVDVFVATYPAFAEHREWVTQLADAMRATIEASNAAADEETDAGAGGDTSAAS